MYPERMACQPGDPDDQYAAYTSLKGHKESRAIFAHTWGFTIPGVPLAQPIEGAEVAVIGRAQNADTINTHILQLRKPNMLSSDNKGLNCGDGYWSKKYEIQPPDGPGDPAGDPADIWGFASLIKDEVIHNDFGLIFAVENCKSGPAPVTVWVACIRMTLYWNDGSATRQEIRETPTISYA
jgi:hypothetical protein